ncbi:hypothetical protein N431DRAFT_161089 [Stipitochalara longipes BDJ]|nr:hypothetical protein N431DRAFT_161089 [Stipitochalara longipes BDJ]
MGKRREKLRKWLGKDGRATAPPGNLSESTNALPSNPTERHVPPDFPAQVGSTNASPQLVTAPTAEAISIASVVDPPAELAPEGEGQDPVQLSDKEIPQGSSELLQVRPSCWDKAAERLKATRPDVYKKLEEIKSNHKDRSQSDPAGLLEFAESKMQENKGIPRVVETIIRSILQFKEIVAAAANFDPHQIAPIVWQGFCVVLEVSLPDLSSHNLGEFFLLIGMLG